MMRNLQVFIAFYSLDFSMILLRYLTLLERNMDMYILVNTAISFCSLELKLFSLI